MSLNDLQKKIYKRKDENQSGGQPVDLDLNFRQKLISPNRQEENEDEIRISEMERKLEREDLSARRKEGKIRKKIFLWGGIASAALILLGTALLAYFLENRAAFREKDIFFELEYSEEVSNGDEQTIAIKYGNFSRVSLKNASISFQRSDAIKIIGDSSAATAKQWDLGDLEPGKPDKIEIPARVFGSEGAAYFIESNFQYVPENFNSIFKISRSGKINVASAPIKIFISAPADSPSGRKVEYSVICENISENDYAGLILRMEFSSGFSFESAQIAGAFDISEIEMEGRDIAAGSLLSGEKSEYIIAGNLIGDVGRGEIVKAKIGFEEGGKFYAYNEEEVSTMIRQSEILITQSVEGNLENAGAGDIIYFKIAVKNTSETGLTGVEIRSELEGSAIDFSSIKAEKGFVNLENAVLWNSSGVPQLAYFLPSQEVELTFSLKIKSHLPIASASAKNFSFSSSPSAKAIELSGGIAGNPVSIKVNSKLVLAEKGFYWEDGKLKNSGPIPPRVGQTTTYTIHWQLLNLANDAKNVNVSANLPAGVGWSGSATATNGTINFDSITRTVIWDIGSIPANIGVKLPIYEAVFQISVAPAQADVGKVLTLLEQASVSGVDDFTGAGLFSSVPAKTTELREDDRLDFGDYKVVY